MMDILSTKLFIPRPRSNLISRRQLYERLDAGVDRKLTLIAAPAGFGKTTLVSDWIQQSRRSVAWLSLDDGDNDPSLFWAYFIASLQQLHPHLGDGALALLQSPQVPPITSALTALINEVTALPEDVSIVLNDYQLINFQPIHTALTFLIDHLPANMHLIVVTRADPPLPLARLRVHDQLAEIRANDLRFTTDEAGAFLARTMGLNLPDDDVIALATRTEGWIAGLQIAALSLQGRDDVSGFVQALSGSHRHILGYLSEEVLSRQPEDTVNFLLQTSILDRLCGQLCDAVTGQTDGGAILGSLEQANLFLIPLDDEGVWYRYHHLFAEVLQLRLRQTWPGQVAELHCRAQTWLEQNGWTHEAINHALAGQDFEHAADLIEQVHGAKWQTGELRTLQGWLAALPESCWRAHPRLWLVQAWVAMTVGDLVNGDVNLRKAEDALVLLDEERARVLRTEVAAFRACHASLTQDPRAVELARNALRDLPEDYWMRGMLVVFLGAAYYSAGDLDSALDALVSAPPSGSSPPGAGVHRIHLLALKGTVHRARGCLRDALALLHQALELAEPGGKPIPFVGTLLTYMSLAPVLYERGELDLARDYLARCHAQAVAFGSHEVQVYALSWLARISLAHDDRAAAAGYYVQIDSLLQAHGFSISIMSYVDYHRFLLLLKQENLTAASAWVEARAGQAGPLNAYAFHRLALPQILIARGDFDSALDHLAALIQAAEASGHGNLLIKALVLQAIAQDALRRHDRALITLERALGLAEPEGFVRAFVDGGAPMQSLLMDYQRFIRAKISDGVSRTLLNLLSFTDTLLAAFFPAAPLEKPEHAGLLEPLSERELDILRLIATGRSNREIADLLVIAQSTVKSHINSLYGKLGTQRRTQAILIARERGLLSG